MADVPPPEYRRLKLFLLLDGPGSDVLSFILKRGTRAPTPSVDLDEYYLTILHQGKNKKNPFNYSQMKQIKNNPSWDNFDVTLLYQAISLLCEHVHDPSRKPQNEMEHLISKIKDERNDCVHEKKIMTENKFQEKFSEIERIFDETLTAGKNRYSVSDSDFTVVRDKVLQGISSIKKALTLEEILERNINCVLPLFKEKCKMHLQNLYQQAQYFDPLSFLCGSPMRNTHIQSIFCNACLMDKTSVTKNVDIDCLDVLTLKESRRQTPQQSASSQITQFTQVKKPQFIMVSGDAGAGKTTLLRYIISEWTGNDPMNRIKHLKEYEIVFWILCREQDGPSLQDFLEQVLPTIFVGSKKRLVSLLKECRVLFLIDGLDELSPGSSTDRLVTDILNKCKNVPDFTVICTSRPETVHDFLNKTPDSYQRWKLDMKGVSSIEDRTEFVLKHYDSMTTHTAQDRESLKIVMKCIGWRDHLGLPLNLLFLATLFHADPELVKATTTQTNLYFNIHEWCFQKLQGRLAGHSQVGRDRQTREDGTRKVLEVMYKIALEILLQNRLSFSQEDINQLRSYCSTNNNLPHSEVTGAFLCLREDVVNQVVYQKYSAPHKSVLEFWAAKYIASRLLWGPPPTGVVRLQGRAYGGIISLLQDSSPKTIELQKLKNLLLHVAGLLSQPGVPPRPLAMQEVVDLLSETGVKSCNDWLSLLEDTNVNSTALDRIVMHITREGDESLVEITDSTVTSAAALLPLIPTKTVEIELQREVDVSKLCRAIAGHVCTVITVWQHNKQPHLTPALDAVLCAVARSQVEEFTGHLSPEGINLLQECHLLHHLHLALSGGPDTAKVLASIADVCPSLPNLSRFWIHIPVKAVQPGDITSPVPHLLDAGGRYDVVLTLTGVEDDVLDHTCDIAAKLLPTGCTYMGITFPQTNMKVEALHRLIDKMAAAGVRTRGVGVPRTITMTDHELQALKTITRNRIGGGVVRKSERRLWKW